MIDSKIPIVDLDDFFSENTKKDFVNSVGSALEDIGFFAVKNHSISPSILNEMYSVSTSFFDQPESTKKSYERPEIMRQRGYTSFGREHAKDSPVPDLKEFYMIAREETASSGKSPFGPNIWPTEEPDFKQLSLTFFDKLENLSNILLQCCASYIEEESDFFTKMTRDSDTILRVIHYPPVSGEVPEGSIRSGAHEDINLITLLCSSTARGLELLQRNGQWLAVETGSEYVVVDSGDMMQNITNGLFRSTTHRVVNPPEVTERRFSMPFFVHPRKEVDLTPIKSCILKTGGNAKYPVTTAGEYLEKRLGEIGLA